MALLSKEQLENASKDSDSLAEFVNGDESFSVTTRLGRIYPSVSRLVKNIIDSANVILGSIGYAVPVTYAAGIQLTQPNQTVSYNNVIYAPLNSSLPFTTSGTFETAKFRVVQGVSSNSYADSGGSSLIGFIHSIGGAVARTVQSKARDFVTVKDTGAVLDGSTNENAAMLAASVPGTVYLPAGDYSQVTIPSGSYNTSWVFNGYSKIPVYLAGAGEPAQFARRTQFDRMPGPHIGVMNQAQALIARPVGSGTNGPNSADYGFTISMIKEGWPNSTQAGEIDGMNIVVRNSSSTSGGYNGDCAGILLNVGVTGNGYAAAVESQTSVLSNTGGIIRQLAAQQAVVDPVANNYIGYYVKPTYGNGTVAFFAASGENTGWEDFFRGDISQNGAGRAALYIKGDGRIEFYDVNGQGSKRTIRNRAGFLSILNNASSVESLTLSDEGALSVAASVNAKTSYAVNNVQVLRERETGYTPMTGPSNKVSNYSSSTVTLQELAARVKALQDTLAAHGLIGL